MGRLETFQEKEYIMITQKEINLPAFSGGFHLITDIIREAIDDFPQEGLLHIFIKHTSAGITLNENADPTVRKDLENIFGSLVPESRAYMHSSEGPDDMPAHAKASVVGYSVSIPIKNGRMLLGAWQGIYLCEFRNRGGSRKLNLMMIS